MRLLGRMLFALLLAPVALPAIAHAEDITSAGHKLAAALDAMNVEQLWLSKHIVNWKTGEPLNKAVTDGKAHTHCSAFVAAACMRQGIYILRPPEHSTVLLANAQFDWLSKEGNDKGWKPVKTAIEAQHLANKGFLVVAAYKDSDSKKSGHIAIVRPSTKSRQEIKEEGPQIIQAGMTNANSISLKEGFKHHPMAWKGGAFRYFAHELNRE